MKKFALALCAATLFFACNNADTKTGDTKPGEPQKTDVKAGENTGKPAAMPDSAEMMKNWQAYMTPGDVHKMMAKWDGTWNGDVSVWMKPGAPEQKSTSTAVNKMIMKGLYQESDHSGNMMGMPFNGKSTLAYDIHRKEFISTWIDNMGSGIMVMKGTWDDAAKTINLKGRMTDPGTKGEIDARETFTIIDDNTQQMEMFLPGPDGKEYKSMSIKFTRKK